jgi:hypothetical protein
MDDLSPDEAYTVGMDCPGSSWGRTEGLGSLDHPSGHDKNKARQDKSRC